METLGFFPPLYPDELFYSAVARYHVQSGNHVYSFTSRDMYDSAAYNAVFDLPTHLETFMGALPVAHYLTLKKIISDHTLYPYYAAFMPKERAELLYNSMRNYEGVKMHALIGNNGKMKQSSHFRFCPQCHMEQYEKFNELYWDRIHQIPQVIVCPRHGTPLQDSTVPVMGGNKYIVPNETNCIPKKDDFFELKNQKMLLRIAKEIKWLVDNYSRIPLPKDIDARLFHFLQEQQLIKMNDHVHQGELHWRFVKYYTEDTLDLLDAYPRYDSLKQYDWISRILKHSRQVQHPIRYLLLIGFLAGSLEEFYHAEKLPAQQLPYGEGPWLCLNSMADHQFEPVVTHLDISHCKRTNQHRGTFTCSCGFVYRRIGPDLTSADRYRYNKVITYGPVWEEKLIALHSEGLSTNEIARRLRISYSIIKKKLPARVQEKQPSYDVLSDREEWLSLQKANPGYTKSQLRHLNGSLFQRLYKKDRDWLHDHSPDLLVKQPRVSRVDWVKRDELLARMIEGDLDYIFQTNWSKKPGKITVPYIGKRIGALQDLHRNLDKLPRTAQLIEKHVESSEDYEIRCLKWAANYLHLNKGVVSATKIRHLANSRSFNNKITAIIHNLVKEFRTGD